MRVATSLLASFLAVSVCAQATPERVLLTANANMAETAIVTWRTRTASAPAMGQIAFASADPRFVAAATGVPATSTQVTVGADGPYHYHTVRFTGLSPETAYSYRVGDGATWSEWIDFRTGSREPKPFAFIYFGDAQNDIKSLWSRAIRNAFRELPKAALMLHAGDLINKPTSDLEWGEWFDAGGWIHSTIPTMATPGNHEYAGSGAERAVTPWWKPQFAFPENGPVGLERTCYAFDYQGVRFISLNSNERIEAQTHWLERQLQNNPNRWTVATFHHPVYSTAKGRDNAAIRAAWQPLFQKYNVALVLQGHDHTYGRKNVPTGLAGRDPRSGTVYVVSVSGPKMYRLGETVGAEMTRVAEYSQLFQIVRVTPERLRFEAYLITGELYDAFELTKNLDGSNRFMPVPVKTPQRVEPPAGAPAVR